jgi:hypothetical protein
MGIRRRVKKERVKEGQYGPYILYTCVKMKSFEIVQRKGGE